MRGSDTRTGPIEILAQQLRPGDRFQHDGAAWFAVYVAVTHGGPVAVRAQATAGNTILSAQTEMTLAGDEIVRLR
jgi:hypothetical protein